MKFICFLVICGVWGQILRLAQDYNSVVLFGIILTGLVIGTFFVLEALRRR